MQKRLYFITEKGEKNKMSNNLIGNSKKTTAITIAIFLTLSIIATTMTVPTASAHSPPWNIPTYAYIVAAPDPVGIGQTAHVYMWLDPVYGVTGGSTAAIGTNGSTASAALIANNYRFHNYNLTIVAPDGTSTTTIYPIIYDSTSNQFTKFTPDKLGTYTLIFSFPGQKYGENGNGYEGSIMINDTYLPSSASTTLIVQQNAIPDAINSYPLPQQYWSHPIYGENTDWWAISSNWLGASSGPVQGYGGSLNSILYHPDGVGPLTSHVMWTRPLQFGGVVGGNPFIAGGTTPGDGSAKGAMYYEGSSYQPRFSNPIIINGVLFYKEPVSFTGPSSGPTDAVDLRTGQVLWSRNDVPALSFGLIFNVWDQDQHGTFPPILFTSNYAQAFDAYTGNALFNVTGVPAGTNIGGPSGENLKYVFANAGTAANPQWYLAEWNSSKLWQYDINPYTGGGSTSPSVINASNGVLLGTLPMAITGTIGTLPNGLTTVVPYGSSITVNANIPINSTTTLVPGHGLTTYEWNISIPIMNTMPPPPASVNLVTGQLVPPAPGANPVTIIAAKYGDILLCRNGSLPAGFAGAPVGSSSGLGYPQLPYTYFAINLNASRGAIGTVLWMKTYDPPAGNVTLLQSSVDFDSRVFVLQIQETLQFQGYSLEDGSLLWTTPPQNSWNYYFDPGQPVLGTAANGNFYNVGFGGVLYAYNDKTGQLLWTYGNGGAGNSTNGGLQIFYGTYPTELQFIMNGVVYISADEHTIPNPIYKGALLRAINATDGSEIWTLSEYPSEWTFSASTQMAAADGFLTAMNGMDNNIYSIGRGPSAITVEAQPFDTSIVIRGSVTDISAGTKQATQAADFPNGVPVASDASMKDWMGYVYQQKPLPTNFTGVDVTINVLDSNGNFRSIGTATTDNTGMYSLTWKPDIPGNFKVLATFAGSNGYWQSSAETTFAAAEPHATLAPTATPAPASMTDTYVLGTGIAIIVVLIIIGAAIMLMLRKRP